MRRTTTLLSAFKRLMRPWLNRSARLLPWVIPMLSGLVSYKYVRDLFVVRGPYFYDAGWLHHSLCATLGRNPKLGQNLYGADNILGLHGFFSQLGVCHLLKPVVSDSFQRFWILISCTSVISSILGYLLGVRWLNSKPFGFLLATILPLTSISQGSVSYPHPEAIAAGLAALGLVVLMTGRRSVGLVLLAIGCLGREDIGIHVVFVVLIASILSEENRRSYRREQFKIIVLMSLGLSVLSAAATKIFFQTNKTIFKDQYLGPKPFEVLRDSQKFADTATAWLTANPALLGFTFLLGLGFVVTRDKSLGALALIGSPWIALNFLSPNPSKSLLGVYHPFPWLVYLTIGLLLISDKRTEGGFHARRSSKCIAAPFVIASVGWWALVSSFANYPSGTAYVTRSMFFDKPASAHSETATRKAVETIRRDLDRNTKVTIDHAVASWIPNYDLRVLTQSDSIKRAYYFRIYSLDLAAIDAIAQQSGLTERVCLAGTTIEARVSSGDSLISRENRCDP